VVDEVLKKDQRSNENDNSAKGLGVVRSLSRKQGSSDRIESVEERERRATYPGITTRCRDKRDRDEDAAVTRKNEWIE
jgi:hypothetical protein